MFCPVFKIPFKFHKLIFFASVLHWHHKHLLVVQLIPTGKKGYVIILIFGIKYLFVLHYFCHYNWVYKTMLTWQLFRQTRAVRESDYTLASALFKKKLRREKNRENKKRIRISIMIGTRFIHPLFVCIKF